MSVGAAFGTGPGRGEERLMDERADWLTGPCPAWCREEHALQDQPRDRRHDTAPEHVPVIRLDRRLGETEVERVMDASEFMLGAYQYLDDSEVWVFVGDDEQHIEVSLESARRVHAALTRLLERLRP